MRIKCPQCKAKIDKKSQYCQYCGYEMGSVKSDEKLNQQNEEYPITNKTAFITEGEVFKIGNKVAILGIAVQKISVGDSLNFKGYDLVVSQIDLLRMKNVACVENGNAVLMFAGFNDKKFKKDILAECEKYSFTNKPIAFSTNPTTKYTFIDLK